MSVSSELFKSFLDHHREKQAFANNAKACSINPYDYQNYYPLIQNCIEDVKNIFEAYAIPFSDILLNRAFTIQRNPIASLGNKTFQYRKKTVEAGEKVCVLFDRLCVHLRTKKAPDQFTDFAKQLDEFRALFERDAQDAEQYFSRGT